MLSRARPPVRARGAALAATGLITLLVGGLAVAAQAATTVGLGTAAPFAVLAATGVSDVPASTIWGDVGVSPAGGASITGLTCDEVGGEIYTVDDSGPLCRAVDPARLTTARADRGAAYLDASGRIPTTTFSDGDNQLGGDQTLVGGVYRFGGASSFHLTGELTLSGDESSVWIFQGTSDLKTASLSTVTLTGGAKACNVFWVLESAATLGTGSHLVGTVMTGTEIVAQTEATIEGRLLAGSAVTLDQNTITRPDCAAGAPPSDGPTVSLPPTETPPVSTPATPSETAGPTVSSGPESTTTTTARVGGSGGSGGATQSPPQITAVPRGSVAAGDASTVDRGTGPAVAVLGAVLLLAGGGAAVAVRTRSRS